MARPTEEKKDKPIKLRISEELYDKLAKRGSNLSDTIRNILKEAVAGEKNDKISVPQNELGENLVYALKEIEGMASFFGITTEEMTEQFFEMLNEGVLTVEEGRLVAVKESWVERLEDVCHDKCIPVEKAVESVIKGLK